MWKGIKKALGHRAKAQKTGPADVSVRSTSSAGQSSHGALFALDMAEVDAMLASAEAQGKQQNQQLPAPAAALTWAQLQQQLAQQHAVQALMHQTEDSTSKRRAAAMQKRVNNSMLNPSTCMYQIKALLSLSTLFEHKLQRDTLQALQQQPSNLVSSLAALAQQQQQLQQQQQQALPSKQQQQQAQLDQHYGSSTLEQQTYGSSTAACEYCQGLAGDSGQGSFCSCEAGGPASLRTPSATAASTAHVALLLASWGYRVIVRKVLHSKAYWTKSMDNTFIVALDSSSGNHVEYIVDPHFQEAFNVGVMSDNYRAVWQALPRVFVGMPCQLQSAVQLLCEEMELSFLEAGRPCPPWRGWAATINRWMSDQFMDVLVPEPGASNEEITEYMSRCTQLASGGCGPGSSASSTSTATRGSSTGLSTCSPPGGNVSQQRLGDKVHVSSVLSNVSNAKERRVPEPLQKQLGFTAEDEGLNPDAEQQQQQQGVAAVVRGKGADLCQERRASSSGAVHIPQQPQQQSAAVPPTQQQQQRDRIDDGPLVKRSYSSSSSGSCTSGSSSCGGSNSSGGSGALAQASRGKSLLTAQMQFRQQLQQQQQQQQSVQLSQGGGMALHQSWMQLQQQHQQQQQLLLLQQQQQQQLLMQQLQQQSQAPQLQQQQAQQLHQVQLQLLLQQQQQQPAVTTLGGCAPLLPVVHTVRPCGLAPGGIAAAPAHAVQAPAHAAAVQAVPAAAAAMHAAALQQLMPAQARLQQQQQVHGPLQPMQLHPRRPQQQQQQQQQQDLQAPQQQQAQLQLQATMHSSPEEQPRLLRLIPRNKAA